MMGRNSKHNKLIEENPRLASAIVGGELALRTGLKQAREAQGLEAWQVAEKLGWSLSKVEDIERTSTDLKFSDLRRYLLATGFALRYELVTEKALS